MRSGRVYLSNRQSFIPWFRQHPHGLRKCGAAVGWCVSSDHSGERLSGDCLWPNIRNPRSAKATVSGVKWLVNHGAWSTAGFMVWRYSASDRRMDRKSDHASVWLEAGPRYLIRDRDGAYGEVFIRRVRSMGIRDRPTSPRSPWQNGYAERLIGSIRRECLDHVAVFGERHLRHVLLS